MPLLPAKTSRTFPKKIHFAVIGQLTPVDVRNILIWKKYNPDYKVTLHRDQQSHLDQLKLQKLSEDALELDGLARISKGLPSGLASLPSTFLWHELGSELDARIEDLRILQEDVETRVEAIRQASNTDRLTALKTELNYSYNVDSKSINNILRQQSDLENALLFKGVSVVDFKDTLPESPASSPEKEYRSLYDQIAYTYNDFELASRIMKNRILHKYGGLMIDTSVTPEINTDIFSSHDGVQRPAVSGSDGSSPLSYEQLLDVLKRKLSSTSAFGTSPLPDPDSIIRNCVHQAFVRQLRIGPRGSNRWVNTPYRDYLVQLTRSGFDELAKAIRLVALTTPPDLFFKGLGGALPTHNAHLSIVDNSRAGSANPLIIAAKPNAAALEKTIKFFALCYDVISHDSETDLANAKGVDDKYGNTQALKELEKWLKDRRHLPGQSIQKRKERITEVKNVLSQLPYRGVYVSTDNLGYLMGREAMVMMSSTNPPLNVQYSHHVDGGRSIQGVDLAAETYLVKTDQYDNRVIVTLSTDSSIWLGDAQLFQRHPKNTYWVFWDKERKLLFPQAGEPLPLTENSKLVLSGHGGSPGLERLSPGEVADIVSKFLPAGGQVRKINLMCCKLDQEFIHVDPAPNLASQRWLSETFSGRLLESLARKQNSITVGSITFFNKASSTSTFLGKHFIYDFGQSKPHHSIDPKKAYYEKQSHELQVRKPEATVIEMQRAPDGTLTARAKKGNPLLDDYAIKNQLIHVTPPNAVPGNLPSPSVILSISLQTLDLSPYINGGHVIVPADLNIIHSIFKYNISFPNTVIAADPGPKSEGLAFAIKAVRETRNYDDWMAKISEYFPNESLVLSSRLGAEYNNNSERDSKFARLKVLVRADKIDVIKADLPNDLSFITDKYGSNNIAYSLIPLPNSCSIASSRRRRSLSASNCNWDFDKATDRLKLVAGNRIDFQLPDGTATEIGLFEPKNQKLAELQTAIQEYRRRTAITDLANRFGQHTVIALDDASFSVARKMLEKLRGKLDRYLKNSIKVFLANLDKNVLVSARGMVATMISGGAANKITLIGNKDSLSGTKPESVIRTFTSEQRVGWLQIAAPGQTENTLLNLFNEGRLNTLKSLSHVQIFSALPSGQRLNNQNLINLSKQGPGGPIVTSGFLLENIELPLSGAYSRTSLPESPVTSDGNKTPEMNLFDSLQVREALEVSRTSLHLDNIERRLQPIYKSQGMDAEFIPMLGSLTEAFDSGKQYWTLNFYHPITGKLENVRLSDLHLVDSIKSINAGVENIKKELEQLKKTANSKLNTRIDRLNEGMGVVMSLAMLIYQGVNQDKSGSLDMASVSSSQRKLLEAQMYFGAVAQSFEITDLTLTLSKYAAAMKTGKLLSVSDRMLGAIEKGIAKGLRSGKKLLMLPLGAKVIKVAGPGVSVAFSGVSLGLSISQLKNCETKQCETGAAVGIGLD